MLLLFALSLTTALVARRQDRAPASSPRFGNLDRVHWIDLGGNELRAQRLGRVVETESAPRASRS